MKNSSALIIMAIMLACLAGCGQSASPKGSAPIVGTQPGDGQTADLMKARAGFQTKITGQPNYKSDGPADQPPATIFKLVRYPSPAGELAAYLSPDPRDGKKHPAVVYAHGGFGGISGMAFGRETFAPLRDAGFVIFCPSWRGENDNPGRYEMFYGEIDDAVTAIAYLAKVPYVDPSRIYMIGHSTGGTITLLTAEATPQLRAAFSFGGAADLQRVDYGNTPFDHAIPQEVRLRSAVHFVKALKVPTFYFEGDLSPEGQPEDGYIPDALRMQTMARAANAPFSVHVVKGGNHFNIARPLCSLLAEKLSKDTGPQCSVTITPEEVSQAFAKASRPK